MFRRLLILFLLVLFTVPAVAQQASTSSGAYYSKDPRNNTKAVEDTRAKADAGNAQAQFLMGHFYFWGSGVNRDYAEAMKWYRKAADQGFAPAQSVVGERYLDGKGVSKSEEEAAKWFSKAALAGDKYSQSQLAKMYAKGLGVAQDDKESVYWQLLSLIPDQAKDERERATALDERAYLLRSAQHLSQEQFETVLKRAKDWKPAAATLPKAP